MVSEKVSEAATFFLVISVECTERRDRTKPIKRKQGFRDSCIESSQVKSSLYINNRQPYGSLSNVLRKPAGEDGSGRRWRRGSIVR